MREAGTSGGFELWAPESFSQAEHELLVRDRFFNNKRVPRVVWLPVARDDISWFKVFELEAQEVWEKDLLQAVRDYGVQIPREHENGLRSLLPAHAEVLKCPIITFEPVTEKNRGWGFAIPMEKRRGR